MHTVKSEAAPALSVYSTPSCRAGSTSGYAEAVEYALQFGRGLGIELADEFVGMYVNKWTIDYGEIGRHAVRELLRRGHEAGFVPAVDSIDFVG